MRRRRYSQRNQGRFARRRFSLSAWLSLFSALLLTGCGMGQSAAGAVDVDLVRMSSTVAYAQANEMLENPEEYEGKTVRLEGLFYAYDESVLGESYYACAVSDATSCCTVEIEFTFPEEEEPEDLPEEEEEIEVVGTFEVFQRGDYTFCRLKDAKVTS